ncbi:GNAT family N-acetyltransferase [Niallia sp. 03133]|uniref:GNAT family N-acetyltransferase n=1 Tax=Niallia sp. 03133 TaxID=3458060 RepID=UPI004043CD52
MNTIVKKLAINYKTLEEFQDFNKKSKDPLSITAELQTDLVENSLSSSFFGMYEQDRLIGRMVLEHPAQEGFLQEDCVELRKVEILPEYQQKGLGKAFISFAKQFNKPIKTYPFNHSHSFWEKLHFAPIKDNPDTPYMWTP